MIQPRSFFRRIARAALRMAAVPGVALLLSSFLSASEPPSLELTRPIRSWEFVSAVGTHAGLFGNEEGRLEAWVYPLKILRDFHLRFHVDGAVLPAETLARTLIVRPESTTIVYSGDTFSVRETFFVPVHEMGAVISFEVDTTRHLEIEAVFERDFQLEWPGTIGDTFADWDVPLRAFRFGTESGKFDAVVGSPSGIRGFEEYSSNYSTSRQSSVLLGSTEKGVETKLIAIAASFTGRAAATNLYQHLAKDYSDLLRDSAAYYRDYLAQTVRLELPDGQMQAAYDWAKVSMLQGVVDNPFLGKGLVAGYNTSADDERPGFAWFFGRDAEWTSLALDAAGDFATTRSALEFLGKYQRADGKVPHEVSQSANFMDWFKATPFAFASADATPLFVIAVNDYVTRSGDTAFAQQKWDNLWRAYGFLQSTYDAQGFAQNVGVGHGWIEGGPLYPVRQELYQASLGLEAVRSLSHLAHFVGKEDLSQQLQHTFEQQKPLLDKAFWSTEKQSYSYALPLNDRDARSGTPLSKSIDAVSVLATVPMWFEHLDGERARSMIRLLASSDHQTDWGMRILSSRDLNYDPGGYHFGVVWPLFTGWAAVAEYHYHRPLPAYSNLRANALLVFDGSLGHVGEAYSGTFYQALSTGSPHQIWSAAMVVNPILSGLFGLQTDAANCHLDFAPHVPADWISFSINNVRIGTEVLNLKYEKGPGRIELQIQSTGTGHCSLAFSPALSLRAKVSGVRLNGHALAFRSEPNSADQHVNMNVPVAVGRNVIEINVKDNFELSESTTLPPLGSTSRGLRILAETWTPNRDAFRVELSGAGGASYDLSLWGAEEVSSVDGADLHKSPDGKGAEVHLEMPASVGGVDSATSVIFHFK
jgi:glycogen debranching enzyme